MARKKSAGISVHKGANQETFSMWWIVRNTAAERLQTFLKDRGEIMDGFFWVRTDVGEALINVDQIAAIHWRNNVRETQTCADVLMRNGVGYKIYDFPLEPVLSRLAQENIRLMPMQYVSAEQPEEEQKH